MYPRSKTTKIVNVIVEQQTHSLTCQWMERVYAAKPEDIALLKRTHFIAHFWNIDEFQNKIIFKLLITFPKRKFPILNFLPYFRIMYSAKDPSPMKRSPFIVRLQ